MVLSIITVSSADYKITSYAFNNAGGVSSSGAYVVTGMMGRWDPSEFSGGNYVLSGGFWQGSGQCIVNLADLIIMVEQWLAVGGGLPADLDHNRVVDFRDFAELSLLWYNSCPDAWPLSP